MAFTAWLPKIRDHREHFNKRTRICYHQASPLVRVVVHVGDTGQVKPHLEHNPLSLLGTCHAMPLRKLNDPASPYTILDNFLSVRQAARPRLGQRGRPPRRPRACSARGSPQAGTRGEASCGWSTADLRTKTQV